MTTSKNMNSSVRAIIGAEVLVIDKDASVRQGVSKLAGELEMHPTVVADPAESWELLKNHFFSVAVVDLDSPHPNAGIETVASIQMISKGTEIIMLTPRKSYDSALAAIRAGARDVVHKTPESVAYLKREMVLAAVASLRRKQVSATLLEASSVHDSFLSLLMTSEQQLIELQDSVSNPAPSALLGDMRILVVTRDAGFVEQLSSLAPKGYVFEHVQTGGEALDRGSNTSFHFAFVSHDLPDLPQSMVTRSLTGQSPELISLSFRGPCEGGSVEMTDSSTGVTVVKNFTETSMLVECLPRLSEGFRAKQMQRRYTEAFREKHYDFVRKFVAYKEKLDELID